MSRIESITQLLSLDEVALAFDRVVKLYPYVPSMSMWRAYEYASYKRFQISGPVLDMGCGDGHFFKFVWPEITDVVGIDIDISAVQNAKASGVYRSVYNVSSLDLPFEPESITSVFANCSLEHMENIDIVFKKIANVLRPKGSLLFSVTTDKFLEWATLPQLVGLLQGKDAANIISEQFINYHHLVSALTPLEWVHKLELAGLHVIEHIPIVPEMPSRISLLMDCLWHHSINSGELLGSILEKYFMSVNEFPEGLSNIYRSLLQMEKNHHIGSGAVFHAVKKEY